MNRSFRAQESQMQAAVKQRPQLASLRTSMMKEKDEELALFLEMRRCENEKERDNMFLHNSEEFDAPHGSKPGSSPIFDITSPTPAMKAVSDDFLNSDNDKNDYDWLMTPPGTPLFPSLEMEQKTIMSQVGTPKARPTMQKSRLALPQQEPAARSSIGSRQPPSSPGLNTSSVGIRRPLSSGGPGSRPATPTGRPTLTSTSKPVLTTASKPTLSHLHKPGTNSASKPSRSPTPTTRATLNSSKPTVPSRSSTPLSRTTARSSAPTARPTVPAPKSTSRAATPTRRPSIISGAANTSAPSVKSPSSSGIIRSGPVLARNPVPSHPSSPTVKSRTRKPSDMPGFSLDAPPNLRTSLPERPPPNLKTSVPERPPPNLRTSLPERPLSAARGRPGVPSPRSSSVEAASTGRVRRQSCSPSRGRAPNGIVHSRSSVPAMSRLHSKANDYVSPVLMGTKMVERVINMRKLVPPKQDDKHSPHSNLSGKSSSPDSSGFGRTLSKKSLDMAIRHMDIRRSIPGNIRPLMTNIPASSMYSVRSGPLRSRTISVSDSPLATSSNASSEVSINNNGLCLDHGSEMEDDIYSEKGVRPPADFQGR